MGLVRSQPRPARPAALYDWDLAVAARAAAGVRPEAPEAAPLQGLARPGGAAGPAKGSTGIPLQQRTAHADRHVTQDMRKNTSVHICSWWEPEATPVALDFCRIRICRAKEYLCTCHKAEAQGNKGLAMKYMRE